MSVRQADAERIARKLRKAGIYCQANQYLSTGSGRFHWRVLVPERGVIVNTLLDADKVICGDDTHLERMVCR
jgi:hypothetical protein